MVPGQNIDQRKNVDATYPQMAARFFLETGTTKEVPDSFHGWKFKKKNKYATILQRSLNWDTTFWGGGKN